jgi:purine-nucleoside phosphorylase
MKVLAGPRVDLEPSGAAALLCSRLAGEDGRIVSLASLGLRDPYRRFSAAEVHALREVLRGETGTVGYVCWGAAPAAGLVVVTDHVNLTWRSPLAGVNDDSAGPRFPGMDGVYAPEAALAPGAAVDGIIVVSGVVAGVPDDRAVGGYESEMAARFGWAAVSSELVAPVIVAAHMGLRVAAVVMVR